ncbi:MAG: hypothetical protein IJW36_01825 [Clostridia bacterium]|nr:hypothetical protein [Clostridia bacterium]
MEEMIFFNSAKENVTNFFEKEFINFPPLLMSHFLNKFNDILNYTEEGTVIQPKILFTNNIDSIVRSIPKTNAMVVFEDSDATKFNLRLKSILPIIKNDWCLFIDIKENKITYGILMSFFSIKDKNLLRTLQDNTSLKDKPDKVYAILARPLNFYSMMLHSISGNDLIINFSLDKSKSNIFRNEISEFVDATFSKLRTTQRKLQDMKNMYLNIFTNVLSYINGSICVIVDKDYKDNGIFEDGIWLKEPISFSKLFTQSKSYNEEKLQAYADLFMNMLNFDGITIIDNQGRLRAYNVFVEPNSKKVGYIVGGARKRAAYYILSTKKKDIIGVYFQSHEGEVFFQLVPKREPKNPPKKKLKVEKVEQTKTEKVSDKTEKPKEKASIEQKPTETKPKENKELVKQ